MTGRGPSRQGQRWLFSAWFKIMIPQVTAAGWLGSSWQLRASPQCEGPRSGGVALRASTPATPGCNLFLNHARFS